MIIADNVSYTYNPNMPFEKTAVHNISLTINDGEFVAIIGHTGSGKSTLIQMFNGLNQPTQGTILIDGENPKNKSVRFKVGLVMQYPEYQLFDETVYKDISFGPKNMGLTSDEIDKRVREAINLVGLSESKMNKSPFELSGGQKRRAAIAGVIAMKPKVLILDEPTAGLDPAGSRDILAKINQMHKETDMAVILVSHSMEDVAQYAQRIIVLNRGSVEMDAPPSEIFKNADRLREIGLSVPQITRITDALRSKGMPLPEGIYDLPTAKTEIIKLFQGRVP